MRASPTDRGWVDGPVERSPEPVEGFERPAVPLPFVTVIMPVRNEAGFIGRSLGAVLDQDYPADRMEVLVVDGASDDDTAGAASACTEGRAQSETPAVRVLTNGKGIVPASLNLGLGLARGDVVVRVDGHCEIAPDYVRRCIEGLDAHKAWCVGGPMHTLGTGPAGRAIALAQSSRFGVGAASFRTGTERPQAVDTVAFGAYRREVFERVGGFDEELVRNQDDEFNVRVTQAGGSIWLDPSIRSVYHSRGSLGGLWRQYLQYGFYKVRVIQKRNGIRTGRQLVPPLFVTALGAAALASLLTRRAAPIVGIVGPYAVANLGASVTAAGTERRLVPTISAALAAMHLAYGLGFMGGLWHWRSGFRRARRLRLIRPVIIDG